MICPFTLLIHPFIHLFILVRTHGFFIYSVGCNPLLALFYCLVYEASRSPLQAQPPTFGRDPDYVSSVSSLIPHHILFSYLLFILKRKICWLHSRLCFTTCLCFTPCLCFMVQNQMLSRNTQCCRHPVFCPLFSTYFYHK